MNLMCCSEQPPKCDELLKSNFLHCQYQEKQSWRVNFSAFVHTFFNEDVEVWDFCYVLHDTLLSFRGISFFLSVSSPQSERKWKLYSITNKILQHFHKIYRKIHFTILLSSRLAQGKSDFRNLEGLGGCKEHHIR